MAELFGFKFERIKDDKGSEKFTAPSSNDGTIDLSGGGFYSQVLDADGRDRTEHDQSEDIVTYHNNQSVTLRLRIS